VKELDLCTVIIPYKRCSHI